jgi:hypothetical protein
VKRITVIRDDETEATVYVNPHAVKAIDKGKDGRAVLVMSFYPWTAYRTKMTPGNAAKVLKDAMS